MLLTSKDLAFAGVMLALSVILVTIGGFFEISTVFFLGVAAFLTGVVLRETQVSVAVIFLAASVFLSFIFAPQKLYCATYAAFGIYIILAEVLQKRLSENQRVLLWIIKGIFFQLMLAVTLFLIQFFYGLSSLFTGTYMEGLTTFAFILWAVVIAIAEAFWLVFDRAYFYFQHRYGKQIARLRQRN